MSANAYAALEPKVEKTEPEPEPEPPTPTNQIYVPDGPIPRGKPAGKLFGKSLIDDLEARKLEMRSKQRYGCPYSTNTFVIIKILKILGYSEVTTGLR